MIILLKVLENSLYIIESSKINMFNKTNRIQEKILTTQLEIQTTQ